MIGIDTSAIIDLFKGKKEVRAALLRIRGPYASTQVNYAELMFGLNPEHPKSKLEEEYYDEFFSSISLLKLTESTAKRAAKIHWELKTAGKMVEPFDCLTAGILIENGVTSIMTKNIKHFERMKDLKIISY